MQDHPRRGGYGQGGGVGDGVGNVDVFDAEGRQVDHVSGLDLVEGCRGQQAVVFELVLDQPEGEAGPVDGHVEAVDDEGQGADVVLVAVGQHDGLDLRGAVDKVADVGNDEVDPEHLLLGEHQAGVHDEDATVVLDRHHVQADLTQAAKGDDLQGAAQLELLKTATAAPWGRTAVAAGGRGASP